MARYLFPSDIEKYILLTLPIQIWLLRNVHPDVGFKCIIPHIFSVELLFHSLQMISHFKSFSFIL